MLFTAIALSESWKGQLTKTLRVMQWAALFLLGFCLQTSGRVHSQTITFTGEKVPLEKVFQAIQQQTDFKVFWTSRMEKSAKPVSVHANQMPLLDFLKEIFRDQPLTYEIKASTIVIGTKIAPKFEASANTLFNLPITVRGRIVNEKGEPVMVSIVIKGTNRGTISNANGEFEINNVDDEAELIITSTSTETITVKVNKQTTINITVQSSVSDLSEVVVNKGYYSEAKKLSTGNVSSITSKEIEKQPVGNVMAALIGRVPGLHIQQASGVTGGGFNIQIRGRNSIGAGSEPLYVIDGVPFLSGPVFLSPVFGDNTNILGFSSPFNVLNQEI